jgi:hypothetical protein
MCLKNSLTKKKLKLWGNLVCACTECVIVPTRKTVNETVERDSRFADRIRSRRSFVLSFILFFVARSYDVGFLSRVL